MQRTTRRRETACRSSGARRPPPLWGGGLFLRIVRGRRPPRRDGLGARAIWKPDAQQSALHRDAARGDVNRCRASLRRATAPPPRGGLRWRRGTVRTPRCSGQRDVRGRTRPRSEVADPATTQAGGGRRTRERPSRVSSTSRSRSNSFRQWSSHHWRMRVTRCSVPRVLRVVTLAPPFLQRASQGASGVSDTVAPDRSWRVDNGLRSGGPAVNPSLSQPMLTPSGVTAELP